MSAVTDSHHDRSDGLPPGQRAWAITTIAISISMAVLDTAIANVALPTIARDVHASAADSIWVVNAYQLAVTVSLLPFAALGDILGYRRVYQAGLLVFIVASLLCATSGSLLTLSLARIVQGLGAAGIMSVNTALVRFIFPRHMLGRGLGLNALVVAVSSAIGPTIAAAILAVGPWQLLFAVNVPTGLAAFAIALRSLPHTPRSPHGFDTASAVLSAVTFGLLIVGIDGIGHRMPVRSVAAELSIAFVTGAVLVRRQLSRAAPLLPVDLLRIPIFALSICTSICSFAAAALAYVSLPFYFQNVLGRTQVETGILMTPWPLMVAIVAPIAGRLADRYPAGLLGGIGLGLLAAGFMLLAALPPAPGAIDIAWRMALCGAGFGLFQSPNNRAMISAAPSRRSGGASGMLSTARLLGQTSGAALVAVAFSLAPAHPTQAAVVGAACFAAVAAVISLLRIPGQAQPRPAE